MRLPATFTPSNHPHDFPKTLNIVLSPGKPRGGDLRAMYESAIRNASELYVASAYLTDWGTGSRTGSSCNKVVFLVGTDFGLTRKKALFKVLRWLPGKKASCVIVNKIRAGARRCVRHDISNRDFWQLFWRLWSGHKSRFQGGGLQISGRAANWREACNSLLVILKAAKVNRGRGLDHVVSREIDQLAGLKNPARGAWLSEMLCHYNPELYPIRNGPVLKWLKHNKWRGRRGATEGQRYTELAQQLRYAVREQPAGARNLAELDAAIWQWVDNRGL